MSPDKPQTFAGSMMGPLHEMARLLLESRQYDRLHQVSEVLAVLSRGAWATMDDDLKRKALRVLENTFHVRGWDDQMELFGEPLDRIQELLEAERAKRGTGA